MMPQRMDNLGKSPRPTRPTATKAEPLNASYHVSRRPKSNAPYIAEMARARNDRPLSAQRRGIPKGFRATTTVPTRRSRNCRQHRQSTKA